MYTAYFGLREKPFTIAPDPRYLYMSAQHQEALAHLLYGMNCDGGFVLLTGEVGTGKTTVCRCLLREVPEQADLAVIFNPKLTVEELLETICDELLIPHPPQASIKALVDRLNERLLETNAAGRKTILIIDEAQSLSVEVLEQLRLLTNLETNSRKLLQIILLGQPELRTILSRPEMRQLAQRITARYHLGPLRCEEVKVYVRHRLEVAGCDRPIFPPGVFRMLCRYSRGIPRLVNLICDRALLGAFTHNLGTVNRAIVRQAAREVLFVPEPASRRSRQIAGLVTLLLVIGLGIGLVNARRGWLSVFSPERHEPSPPAKSVLIEPHQAASPAAPPPLPNTWPSAFAMSRSQAEAFADLAALWGVSVPAGARDLCGLAESAGLRCLSRQDSLNVLRALNRPAILTLYDDGGKPFHVVLTRLDRQRAHFAAGGDVRELDADVLESRWFGEFQLLWSPPAFYATPVIPGSSGPAVPWLARSLETLGQYAANGREERLEGHLLGALKRYQLGAGLIPDGLLGPQTLIHLLNALGHDGPVLAREEEGA